MTELLLYSTDSIVYRESKSRIKSAVYFMVCLKLTYGSVFSQEAIVIDYRIRVEVDEHWSKCGEDAWDGISTKSSQWSTTGGRACVDLHTIVDTCGVC